MEIWKPINGFELFYEVSNFGNVRSIDRYIENKYDAKTGRFVGLEQISKGDYIIRKKFVKGSILKPLINGRGYAYVWIAGKNRTIHRIVAEHFLSDPTGKYELVEHLNHNKTDNRVENLMWSSSKANIIRNVSDGRWNNQYTKSKKICAN